jgi:hypothetical protein
VEGLLIIKESKKNPVHFFKEFGDFEDLIAQNWQRCIWQNNSFRPIFKSRLSGNNFVFFVGGAYENCIGSCLGWIKNVFR